MMEKEIAAKTAEPEPFDPSKFINPNLKHLSVSQTLSINEKCNRLIKAGKTVYKFGLGQSPFPIPAPIVESLRLHAPQKDYQPVKGLPALREAVAEFHRRKDHVDISHDNVLIGPGSKELLFLLQLVFNGEIMILSPSWVTYHPQAKILGKKIRFIDTSFAEKWCLTPEKLEQACHETAPPALLIMNYPGNPDGMTYSEEQLIAIAAVARKNGVIILSDEIYGQLHHKGNHVSIARYYPEGTIISSGLSKWCGAGGWRLGTFAFPEKLKWLLSAMAVVASETYTSVSAPIQYAAVQAFIGGAAIEEYLSRARRILSALGSECATSLRNAGVKVYLPDGAFYLFVDFSPLAGSLKNKNINTSAEMCLRLLQDTGVALLPGDAFNRKSQELTARLAYVDFDGAKAMSASEAIPLHQPLPDDFAANYCTKALDGVAKIVAWVKK